MMSGGFFESFAYSPDAELVWLCYIISPKSKI